MVGFDSKEEVEFLHFCGGRCCDWVSIISGLTLHPASSTNVDS